MGLLTRPRSQRRHHHLTVLLFCAILLAGCAAPAQQQLPTAAPSAVAEPTGEQPPTRVAAPTPSPTAPPPPSPTLAATATASPTPMPNPPPTPCARPGVVEYGAFPSAAAGEEHRYAIYLPPCYASDGYSYPTLYLMAGNIHDEGHWDQLGIDEAANEAIGQGSLAPLLIVMPDGGWLANNTSGGPGSYESLILDELIPHVENSYCAWPDAAGRAIGGLSRGGYWAMEIAFRFPDQFNSVGGHSAALLDSFAGPAVNPQVTALTNDLGSLRIYLDIGANDYLRANTIKLHEDMEAAGVSHEWHLNEGEHVDAYWAAHAPEYLTWYTAPWSAERAAYPPCLAGP